MSDKKKNIIKALLFDFGGTLDTGGDHWYQVLYPLMQRQLPGLSSELYRHAFAYGERTLAIEPHIRPEDNFLDLLIKKLAIQAVFLQKEGVTSSLLVQQDVAAGAYQFAKNKCREHAALLRQLKQDYRIALVSNFYGNLRTVLQDFGLTDLFDTVVESAVAGVKKPDPAIFAIACEQLGLPPQSAAVIGDSYQKDMLPATSIGCHGYWLQGKGWPGSTEAVKAAESVHKNKPENDAEGSITQLGSLQDLPGLLEI